MRFVAHLTYTNRRIVNVKVNVEKVVIESGKIGYQKAFEFNVDFLMEMEMQKIYPSTYEEGMLYLEGRRRVNRLSEEE